MKITYQNIANFSVGTPWFLVQFFVEYKEGQDPFGIYLPEKELFFKANNILSWLEELVSKRSNNFQLFDTFLFLNEKSEIIKHDTYQHVIKAMFFYKETFAKEISTDDLEKNWLLIINEKDEGFVKSQLLEEFANFYNENNYKNYFDFVLDFEKHLHTFNPNIDLNQIIDEILVIELFIKNIGRYHMSSSVVFGYDAIEHFVNCSQDEYYENPWDPENLIHTTHFEFDDTSSGNNKVTLNWPWCLNHKINSNVEKDFEDSDYVAVKLSDLMRYSQNYINLRRGEINHYFRDFLHLYEGVVPIVPYYFRFRTQQSVFLSEHNKILGNSNNQNQDKPFSPYYSFLGEKLKVSRKYASCCLKLYNDFYFKIENIYESKILITIPFWEIPRIQLVMSKQYILADNAKYWELRMLADELFPSREELFHSEEDYFTSLENLNNKDSLDNDRLKDEENSKQYEKYLRDTVDFPTKPDFDDFLDINDLLDPHGDLL
jgi:hypothetical protein